ncbi:MAG: hypothetical protein WDN06_18910 [Asticcacaulis sp.]
MKLRTMLALAVVVSLARRPAHAQVSDDEYAAEYNFIVSNDWRCATAQKFDEVEDGELNMEQDFHFDPYTATDSYAFTGTGSGVMNVDGVDYRGQSRFDGYGFNDASRGAASSSPTRSWTQKDTLPGGWYWNDSAGDMELVLTQEDDGAYSLKGYSVYNGVTRYL